MTECHILLGGMKFDEERLKHGNRDVDIDIWEVNVVSGLIKTFTALMSELDHIIYGSLQFLRFIDILRR